MWNRKHQIAPGFDWRLKVALDRIKPPSVMPRYAMLRPGFKPWRLAPIALAGAATVLLALSATAATGSANPVVWSQRAASTIQSVGHAPEPSPTPASSTEASPNTVRTVPAPAPKPAAPAKAAPKPAPPAKHADESPRPTPSDDNSGSNSHDSSPKPSPPPDEH
jgi:hypothetical protein